MSQLQNHKKIDEFFKTDILSASIKVAQELIATNLDSKRYFFSKANEFWLRWIWENGLLDNLKKKSDDPTKYGYQMPELEYLVRMAEKIPEIVTTIILAAPISKETFNPEVIDRFFWITGLLPTEKIKDILPKILSENWLRLMMSFNRSGYEYKRMVEKLAVAKDYDALLILAQIILTVRAKEEFTNAERFSISDKLFYLGDISDTGIFELIISSNNPQKEKSLEILLSALKEVVTLGKKREETVFAATEPFYLLDVDIFTLELDTSKRSHFREDIQNLVASCKVLIRLLIESTNNNPTEIRRIYDDHIATLPDSLTCWRLKLYTLTRSPDIFKSEIEEMLFRVFKVGERHFELDAGAEYHQGLIAGFGSLDEPIQRNYVKNVFDYYGATLNDKDREKWRKRDGLEILTYIKKYLTPEEIEKTINKFGIVSDESKIVPHPSIGKVSSGFVSHKPPFNPSELSVVDLIKRLKTDATPESLTDKYREDDFFSPRGAEGLGDAIKEDFKIRTTEYFTNLNSFFDRDKIDAAYVYAILRQVEDMLRAKESFTDDQQTQLINFFDLIKTSGEQKEFEPSEKKSYLADWITVHKSMTDVLIEVLSVTKDSQVFKDNREKIFSLIKYLFSIKSSPDVEDDKRENGDPAGVAINSVRGQAFRVFVQFIYNEGNKTLSDDVKVLYEHIIDTDTSNAVRFTIGQFLASFYYRDVEFIKSLLPKIFPKIGGGKDKEYFATWEGYLSSSLYKELFDELNGYYEYAIKINPSSYPERKYLKGLDETLAVHIGLAYAHFDFKIGDSLFDLFWKTSDETRHYEFVSFIGRTYITRSQAGDKWFEENKVNKEKLIAFWNWIISTDIKIEPKVFSGFGFWINPDTEVIDEKLIIKNLVITLNKSQGEIDWDYGLTRKIKKFAELDPERTLKIIEDFLLLNDELNPHRRSPLFSLENEIEDALKIIFRNTSLKKSVEDLVDVLIEKGSSPFWALKDVLISDGKIS